MSSHTASQLNVVRYRFCLVFSSGSLTVLLEWCAYTYILYTLYDFPCWFSRRLVSFHLLSCVLCAVIIFDGKWLRMVLCSCGWEHNSPLVYDTIYAELDCAELHRARERTQNFHALHTPYTDTMRMLMHTTTRTRSPSHQANIRCTRE